LFKGKKGRGHAKVSKPADYKKASIAWLDQEEKIKPSSERLNKGRLQSIGKGTGTGRAESRQVIGGKDSTQSQEDLERAENQRRLDWFRTGTTRQSSDRS